MLRPALRPLLLALALGTAAAPALAQRSVAGADDEDDDLPGSERTAPESEEKKPDPGAKKSDRSKKSDAKKPDAKKPDAKKPDAKQPDEKKPDEKKPDEKKPHEKKPDEKKPAAKAPPEDVLEETAAEKKKRSAEDDARRKAEEAAAADEAKKAAEKARQAEERKAATEKRKSDTREQRLASAKRVRPLVRSEGDYHVGIAVEPGAAAKGALVEVRFDIGKQLSVADPKFGSREPLKNLALTATVSEFTGKKDSKREYAVHSLGAPGAYGFHMTPTKDGVVQVQVTGDVGDRTLNVSFPVHVGVWPPPDFDDEDKKALASDGKGG